MTELLLSLHVLAAIVTIGPVTVAASLFPRYARAAAGPPGGGAGPTDGAAGSATGGGDAAVAAAMHRITRLYAVVGVSVPVLGLATGASLGVLGDPWLGISIVLTAVAAGILALLVIPGQERLMVALWDAHDTDASKRLAMQTGVFNLLWAAVVVLMIVRPGSTTG
jgi:hypothetical protein